MAADMMSLMGQLSDGLEWQQIERARRDPVFFGHYCFSDERGDQWLIGDPLHYDWQNFMPRKGPWQGVLVGFRESMKTSQMGFMRVLWELGHDPSLRIKYVTCNDEKARDHLRWIKENIEDNERLHKVFPELRPGPSNMWLTSKIIVDRPSGNVRDCSIEVGGITSNASGGRADLMVFDDIIDYKTVVMQPRLHESIVGHFRNTWLSQGAKGRRIIVIGIPTTSDDLLAQLMIDPAWKHFARPAWVQNEETGRDDAVFPQYWPMERLLEQRGTLGERAFRRQFLLQAINPDERYFSEQGIARCIENWEIGANVNPDWPRYIGVDMAQSLKKKASFTVIFTIAVDPENGRRHPVEIIRAKMRPIELKNTIIQAARNHHAMSVMVENNAMQDAVIEWCGEQARDIPLAGQFTGKNKWDPEVGVPRLITQMENGAWVIPLSEDHRMVSARSSQKLDIDLDTAHCPVCAWKMEMERFPVGTTADTVMAMWLADAAASTKRTAGVLQTAIGTGRRPIETGWRA